MTQACVFPVLRIKRQFFGAEELWCAEAPNGLSVNTSEGISTPITFLCEWIPFIILPFLPHFLQMLKSAQCRRKYGVHFLLCSVNLNQKNEREKKREKNKKIIKKNSFFSNSQLHNQSKFSSFCHSLCETSVYCVVADNRLRRQPQDGGVGTRGRGAAII